MVRFRRLISLIHADKRLSFVLRHFWMILSACLALDLSVTWFTQRAVQENNRLCRRTLEAQDLVLEHVMQVNEGIELQWVDMMQRLGLDSEMMPMMTTALWRRATRMKVSTARVKMNARKFSSADFLKASDVLSSNKYDNPPIGGQTGDDDGSTPKR